MNLPDPSRIELPLLQEIAADGGAQRDVGRRLAGRLLAYFPQLAPQPLGHASPARRRWLRLLSRTAQRLVDRGELEKDGRALALTPRGQLRLGAEALCPEPPAAPPAPADRHRQLQELLLDLGALLGKDAALEHETYDVVWRDRPAAPRLSHVFEVQVAGSVDSALTRLKRAHEAQRSRLFLVVADERSARFAEARLREAFPELLGALRLVGAGGFERLHGALAGGRPLLGDLLGG